MLGAVETPDEKIVNKIKQGKDNSDKKGQNWRGKNYFIRCSLAEFGVDGQKTEALNTTVNEHGIIRSMPKRNPPKNNGRNKNNARFT